MPISVDWPSRVITVPQSYCTHVTGTLYELDTDQMRRDLKQLEDDEEGIVFQDTHRHNSPVTVAGVTFAQVIEVVNGYSLVFSPDAQWTVRLVGSNNNLFDVESGVLVQNQVQVIAQNSGGLIVGAGSDPTDVATAVWSRPETEGGSGSMGERLRKTLTLARFVGLK